MSGWRRSGVWLVNLGLLGGLVVWATAGVYGGIVLIDAYLTPAPLPTPKPVFHVYPNEPHYRQLVDDDVVVWDPHECIYRVWATPERRALVTTDAAADDLYGRCWKELQATRRAFKP
jgi:hypothetical protein